MSFGQLVKRCLRSILEMTWQTLAGLLLFP
jgi:hypothetical protein